MPSPVMGKPFPSVTIRQTLGIAQAGFRREFKALSLKTVQEMQSAILRASGSWDAPIPRARGASLRLECERILLRMYVGFDGRSPFGQDGVTPLAPYPALLNKWLAFAVASSVRQHQKWMKRHVPEDVYRWLRTHKRPLNVRVTEAENPFLRKEGETLEQFRGRLDDLRIFRVDPQVDPARRWVPVHLWTDPNGYRLSDRIWNTADETRTKIDRMIQQALNEGWGARKLARQLEQFLVPGRALIRTRRPYLWGDASYDAMRLARTEISRAANEAAYISALLNPYSRGIDWALSISHPRVDICDDYATLGKGGGRLKDPYPLEGARVPPAHLHCVTPGQLVNTLRGNIPIEQVVVGDQVLTHTGQYRRVLAAWGNPYSGTVYNIQTDAGCLELTSEHPVRSFSTWINAENLQPGDQILYTVPRTSIDFTLAKPKGNPAKITKFPISLFIMPRFQRMPVFTIGFNRYFVDWKREINVIAANFILSLKRNSSTVKRLCQFSFDSRWPGILVKAFTGTKSLIGIFGFIFEIILLATVLANMCLSFIPAKISHSKMNKAGVINLFSLRDFASNFRSFGRAIITPAIKSKIGFAHFLRGLLRPCSIVLPPGVCYSFANRKQMQTVIPQQVTKYPKSDSELFANGGTSKSLSGIQVFKNLFGRASEFLLKSAAIPFCFGNAVFSNMIPGFNNLPVANRANPSTHDNLLLLSPDIEVGAGSGKPGVERFMTPFQAHQYYTAVHAIEAKHYQGLVYNMEVEGDNSYTVNGAAVHNCLCFTMSVMMDSAEVTAQLRAVMQDTEGDLLIPITTPADGNSLIRELLGPVLYALILAELANTGESQ